VKDFVASVDQGDEPGPASTSPDRCAKAAETAQQQEDAEGPQGGGVIFRV